MVERGHPLGVPLGQIVVDGHQMGAVPGERIEIQRQGRHQRLALTGLHFSDLALVQDHATQELDIEMPHRQRPPGGLPAHRKRLRQ